MNLKFPLYALALGAVLSLGSCSNDNDSSNSSKLEVRLMDAPGDFQQVSLDVRQIEVHLKDEGNPDGWQTLPFTAQAINVLDYVNGRSALLVSTDFAPGDLKEIRLILGPDSYVIGTDGQRYDLKTPSGQTSGVKLRLDKATLRQRETFQLLLDFDVARSIVERGNWKAGNDKKERYLLKPVIRVVAQDINGGLRGTVTPAAALPQVLAIRRSITPADTFSTRADASGAYQLFGLPSGTYALKYFPTTAAPTGQPAYQTKEVGGVVVVNNQVTTVNPVSLN
ncbi:DUF4382 domain-containing protein [Hymenobacter busanensis]|uniref:DUF4382 domain-containing protein n=1 Tax=Hymenobacter busanensis TaxID=2607656 RepID=A0A7L4ZXX5_9BACT|nr:DUF4382 domain-containing protein [Hymenobacter busanensis]KAA9332972.1 DUF4382 domain-containing protein [Hymenobacter busanensis]QHJ08354.1 DUF4382 domain-containing protein [Hymenobacter busanensis]